MNIFKGVVADVDTNKNGVGGRVSVLVKGGVGRFDFSGEQIPDVAKHGTDILVRVIEVDGTESLILISDQKALEVASLLMNAALASIKAKEEAKVKADAVTKAAQVDAGKDELAAMSNTMRENCAP